MLASVTRFSTRRLASPLARALSTGRSDIPVYSREPVYTPDGIYSRDHENDIFRAVTFPTDDETAPDLDPEFRALVNELFVNYTPSKHSFFATLRDAPTEVVKNPGYLNELYLRYQAAMHITRAMVWFAPGLHDPLLRQRKISIIADDDAMEKDSHHQQLEDMFRAFGASPMEKKAFGGPEELRKILDPKTTEFVNTVERLYPATTGAWCIAEVLSDDWLSALATALVPHFGKELVIDAPYFDEVFSGHIEIIHMCETVLLSESVMARHPEKREPTFAHAREMCENLDGLWNNLEDLTRNPEAYLE